MRRASRTGALSVAFLVALLPACSPRELPPLGQVLVHVDTDGTVPSSLPPRLGIDPVPLFDTLRVDVFEPGQTSPCPGCSRVFALDLEHFLGDQVSFGVPAAPGVEGYRVRLRMYPSRATLSGEPPGPDAGGNPPDSVVDVTVSLPVTSEGILDRTVFLATDAVGVPSGSLDAPIDTQEGPPGPTKVGTWPRAQVVPCPAPPGHGEVCIPGGAFWMGNAKVTGGGIGDAADQLRLVVLSPFYVDQTEMTLARVRALQASRSGAPPAPGTARETVPSFPWSGGTSGKSWQDFCTWSPEPMGIEDTPVNCTSWSAARALCQSIGRDLPTEAQFEFVASAFSGRLYAWGEDDPSCGDAVLGRGGYGFLASVIAPCKPDKPPGGPLAVGADVTPARRDLLELPSGNVYDLVGNMCELSRDVWNRQDEPCWSKPGVYADPLCDTPSPADGLKHVYRGGCWDITPRLATSASREAITDGATSGLIGIGFRCARPAVASPPPP